MAITVDDTSQGDTVNTSLTVEHTCSGSNRCLYVCVVTYLGGGSATPTCTYDSVGMTQIGNTLFGTADDEEITFFRLVNPNTGANDIVASVSPSQELTVGAISFNGVDQTTPDNGAAGTTTNASTEITQDVSSEAGDLVLDCVGWYNQNITVGSGQTQQVLNNNGAGNDSVALSTQPGAGTVTMSWDWSSTETAGQCAININAEGAVVTTRQIKVSGTFVAKPIKTKVSGTFVDKPIKIKVSGTFQDA